MIQGPSAKETQTSLPMCRPDLWWEGSYNALIRLLKEKEISQTQNHIWWSQVYQRIPNKHNFFLFFPFYFILFYFFLFPFIFFYFFYFFWAEFHTITIQQKEPQTSNLDRPLQPKNLESKPTGGTKGVTNLTGSSGTRAHYHHTRENKSEVNRDDRNWTNR